MSVLGNSLLLAADAAPTAYQVSRSLRFNASDSAYLSRTPSSSGNRRTWTWAAWVKRSGSWSRLFAGGSSLYSNPVFTAIGFDSDKIIINEYNYPSAGWGRDSVAVFRDYSAWYHIVVAVDTTQATDTNRVKLYVNGVEQSTVTRGGYSAFPVQNADTYINTTTQHELSASNGTNSSNVYLADIHFIDGQALTPSSFTEVSATTGQLVPKAYTGTYGTNGFKLTFSDNSATTATTLGKDSAGSNNWTPNNFSVTAGAGNDSLVDTPTSYGTDTGAGGGVRGNYCTLNPLDNGGITLANGNLDASTSTATNKVVRGTIGVSTGKWYWEVLVTAKNNDLVGVANRNFALTGSGLANPGDANSSGIYQLSYSNGSVLGFAIDCDAGKLFIAENNTWKNSGNPVTGANPWTSSLTSGPYFPAATLYNFDGVPQYSFNFGQRPFAYTAPSGFKALCDTNLPAPVVAKPSTAFDVKLYTGNGSTQTISGLGFSPDFVWIKNRSTAGTNHVLQDQVRGATAYLFSNTTAAENTNTGNDWFRTFTSDGFTVAGSTTGGTPTSEWNANSATYAAWCWDAGSSTVTNTQGSITSSVRANASAGFSVITATTPSQTTNYSCGHGLGVAPEFYIWKFRGVTSNWVVYHKSIAPYTLKLDSTAGQYTGFNMPAPSSSVINLLDSPTAAWNSPFVIYAFAPVAGYSAMGAYDGSGSTQFIYTGFRPKYLLIKCYAGSSTQEWTIKDSVRNTYNAANYYLTAESSAAEGSSLRDCDFLSNGFSIPGSIGPMNTSGRSYIYFAVAESPFQYARAR